MGSSTHEVRRLGIGDIGLIAAVDRSEHVEVEYTVVAGQIVERPVSMTEIPSWDPAGTGPFSVAAQIEFCRPLIARGAVLLGAFEGGEVMGVCVVEGEFEPPLAWLAFLYVGRPYRRRGVASALWSEALTVARSAGANSIYVSAVPTGSAVGFYLAQGCAPTESVHPELYALEPDDVHMLCTLT